MPHWLIGRNLDLMPVQVVGASRGVITPNGNGCLEFVNLFAAQNLFPDLDPWNNGPRFTWAMKGRTEDGRDALRFETWAAERIYSR